MWIIISNNMIFTEMLARFRTIQFPHYVLSQAKKMRYKYFNQKQDLSRVHWSVRDTFYSNDVHITNISVTKIGKGHINILLCQSRYQLGN